MEDQGAAVRKRRHLTPEEKYQIFLEATRAQENGNTINRIDKETKEVVWDNRGLAKPYRPENWKRKDCDKR